MDDLPDDTTVPSLGPRMRSSRCGNFCAVLEMCCGDELGRGCVMKMKVRFSNKISIAPQPDKDGEPDDQHEYAAGFLSLRNIADGVCDACRQAPLARTRFSAPARASGATGRRCVDSGFSSLLVRGTCSAIDRGDAAKAGSSVTRPGSLIRRAESEGAANDPR
jgi:hypothetical protein